MSTSKNMPNLEDELKIFSFPKRNHEGQTTTDYYLSNGLETT
jgi:hypothetical protein